MKKLGALILGAILTIGVGVGIGVNPKTDVAHAEDLAVYTLTPAAGSNNSYAGNCDVAINGVTWNIEGNSTMNPWRLGGKSITGVDRSVYSKNAVSAENITKVELTVGTANSITVNSLHLNVGTAEKGKDISSIEGAFVASSTITFTRPEGADWSNAYFDFTFNVTNTVNSNKYVQFTEAKFYCDAGEVDVSKVAAIDIEESFVVLKKEQTLEPTVKILPETAEDKTYTLTSTNEEVATIEDGAIVAVGNGYTTITATSTDGGLTDTLTVVVTDNAGTAEEPFTVTDAKTVAQATGTSATVTKYYVTGQVSAIKEFNTTNYGNATFTITDGTSTFDCYRMNDVGGAKFTTEKFIVGDEVTVYGSIINYSGNTPQLNSYGQLVEVEYTAASIASRIKTLAGGWNNNVGTADCATNYATAKEMILALSAEELNTFKTSTDTEIASARTTYENWCHFNGDNSPYEGAIVDASNIALTMNNNNVVTIVIILGAVLALAATLMLISKKRKLAK